MQIDEKELPNVERTSEKKLILIFFQNNNFGCLPAMIYDAIKLAVVKLALGVINETFYFFLASSVRGELRKAKRDTENYD